jgi:xanthine/uracil/vitamin C permease (AzgA family)
MKEEGMAKARYDSQVGAKALIGTAVGLLALAVVFLMYALTVSGRFNSFKDEVSSISGDVKSKIVAEYHGETKEVSKKDFGRIFAAMVSARRRQNEASANIVDTLTFRLSNVGDQQGLMTVCKTDKNCVKVTYQSENSEYTYWFDCGYQYILNLTGLSPR